MGEQMTNSLPENWQIFMEQYPEFMKLQRKLATLDWYKDNGWVMFVGHYHAGIYFQHYKSNWFNYSLEGIHFEAGMTAESLKTKKLQLDLHIGHRNLFDREKFNEITIPQMAAVVATWPAGYRFSKTNLAERLSVDIPFTKTGFANQVADALNNMNALAAIIDAGIAKL